MSTNFVLNECALAENILSDCCVDVSDCGNVSTLLAKYFISNSCDKATAYKKIDAFLLKGCDGYNSVLHREIVDNAINWAARHPLVNIDGISITQSEVNTILAVKSKPLQRVAFVYLCAAKYGYLVNKKLDYWVNVDDVYMFRLAHVSTNSVGRDLMLHELREAGLIAFSKSFDSLSLRVLFVNDDSRSVAYITSFDDLYADWQQINGEDMVSCRNCGRRIKRTGRRQKYCKECAKKVDVEQRVKRRKTKEK